MRIKVRAKLALSIMATLVALTIAGCGSGSSSMSNSSTAMPTFSPGAGTYNTSQTVTISDSTNGAVLYCTTDGSTPTTSSPKCSQPTTVYQTEFLQAIAVVAGGSPSGIASAAYTINLSAAATPAFAPAGGSYTSPQTVTLSDATTGANIYYTTDGTTPTASSTLYTTPIMVSANETVNAIAIASGYSNSGIASATYAFTSPIATPSFSVPSGSYPTTQTVAITDATADAAIYYTTDGSTPTSSSTAYTTPISVTQTETISAVAILDGQSSQVAVAAYVIGQVNTSVAAPTFSLAAGTYTSAQMVMLADTTDNAAIYYTTDGSTPTSSSTAYTAPISVTKSETISAIAIAAGVSSPVVTATYTIALPVAAPVFSIPSGTYATPQSVSITVATPDAKIYYTLDGSTPTSSSTAYTMAINVSQSETITAIAILAGSNSQIVSAAYNINQIVATPVFSVASGSYTSSQTVAISDATPNATIYYAINNPSPTTSSTLYTGAITVSQTQTISAIAVLGTVTSPVATVAYSIGTTVAPPAFAPSSGSTVAVGQAITISGGNPGVVLYYTTDGTTPTSASTKYTAPVVLSQTGTVTFDAVAIDNGISSSVTIATYTVKQPTPPPTFSPASGSPFIAGQAVTIADTDAAATIYYTLDGSTPTTSSTKYTAPVALSDPGSVTINAIAVDSGLASTVATATYIVSPSSVDAPTFTPASGASLTAGQTVTVADTDANATIYYTIDGSAPSAASTQYTAPIVLSTPGAAIVKAVAIDGATSSSVATATYTVTGGGPSINGSVLSGATPIKGAQVQLYAAGIAAGDSGYGSNATALGSAVTTSASGAFTVNVNCPASPGDLIYLVATGGDSGNGPNASTELMTALGPCANFTSGATVTINEVTTVASAYALSQFMIAAPNVGSSSTNYQGLTNAFATVNNLVSVTSGASFTHTPGYPTDLSGDAPILNNSTVPQARINTLADMLNSCTASDGSACASLFAAATPPSGSAPTSTLQAILDVAQHPGANAAGLFSVASPGGPFQPELAGAPNDWTLALTFTGGGLGIAPNTSANYTYDTGSSGSGSIAMIDTSLALDSKGNILVVAYADSGPTFPSYGNSVASRLAEFNNLGAPITPATTLSGGNVVFGGVLPYPQYYLVSSSNLSAVAVDQTGNIWLSDDPSGNLFELSPDLALLNPVSPANPAGTGRGVDSIAIDTSSNNWLGTGTGLLFEFDNAANQILATDATQPYLSLNSLTFDSNGGLWGADYVGQDTYQINTTDGTLLFDAFGNGNGYDYVTLVADGSGNVYGCAEAGGQVLDVFNSRALKNSFAIGSQNNQRGCGTQLVLDGQGHIFAVSNTAATNVPLIAVDEFTTSGAAISPAQRLYRHQPRRTSRNQPRL